MFDTEQTQRLRKLIREATALQLAATQLVAELTEQLERSSILLHPATADDGPERRKKPRT